MYACYKEREKPLHLLIETIMEKVKYCVIQCNLAPSLNLGMNAEMQIEYLKLMITIVFLKQLCFLIKIIRVNAWITFEKQNKIKKEMSKDWIIIVLIVYTLKFFNKNTHCKIIVSKKYNNIQQKLSYQALMRAQTMQQQHLF